MSSSAALTSRRRFLQKAAVTTLAFGAGGILTACATGGGGGGSDPTEAPEGGGDVSDDNPFGVAADATLEVYIFNGGFGDAYATELHEPMFAAAFPDATIDHGATEDIGGELQSRFVGGDPPDVVNNSGSGQIDFGQLISSNQLTDLTPLFDAPSYDDPSVPVRDTLVAGTVEQGTYGDAPYVLNYAFTVFGIWYDAALFEENQWPVPSTWAEMIALCPEIQAAGIAPWTYQGAHPRYVSWSMLAMAAKLAGPEVLVAIDNLEPGAWTQDPMREAATALASLRTDGWILDGTEGMDHVQAQTAWCEGRAAFIPCGSWLESEQADVTPENFRMAVMPDLMLGDSTAMPATAVRASAGEPFVIPSAAQNVPAAMEYMRGMLSREGARGFTEMVSSLSAVSGAADGLELSTGLSSAQEVLAAAGDDIINYQYSAWYRTMENPGIDSHMGDLMTNRVGVDEFLEACEGEAAAVREDDSITKYERSL